MFQTRLRSLQLRGLVGSLMQRRNPCRLGAWILLASRMPHCLPRLQQLTRPLPRPMHGLVVRQRVRMRRWKKTLVMNIQVRVISSTLRPRLTLHPALDPADLAAGAWSGGKTDEESTPERPAHPAPPRVIRPTGLGRMQVRGTVVPVYPRDPADGTSDEGELCSDDSDDDSNESDAAGNTADDAANIRDGGSGSPARVYGLDDFNFVQASWVSDDMDTSS